MIGFLSCFFDRVMQVEVDIQQKGDAVHHLNFSDQEIVDITMLILQSSIQVRNTVIINKIFL